MRSHIALSRGQAVFWFVWMMLQGFWLGMFVDMLLHHFGLLVYW